MLERSFDKMIINISDRAYYLHDEIMIASDTFKRVGDDAYRITYEAVFVNKIYSEDKDSFDLRGFQSDHGAASVFLENYTTAHNLEAKIFIDSYGYNAVIYHKDIKYRINMESWWSTGDETTFKKYLDTLK